MSIPLPPTTLKYGDLLCAGLGKSMVIADMDFETYSEAGFIWNESKQSYDCLPNAKDKGISATGAAVYAQHPTCEVLSLAYDLKDGLGKRWWQPGMQLPFDLFNHLVEGKLIEAWNCSFERWIWEEVCVKKYGFPPLPFAQLRDAKAKAMAFCYPPSLDKAATVMGTKQQKSKDGTRLINKFSIPRKPTKNNLSRRTQLKDDPADAMNLYLYNLQDIATESAISERLPDLNTEELEFWLCDQRINRRGVRVDKTAVDACLAIIKQAYIYYNNELYKITDGILSSASEVKKMTDWMRSRGVAVDNLRAETVSELLKNPLILPDIRRVLEIRAVIGASAVAKLYVLSNQLAHDDRLHDLFVYHGARTGRTSGRGAQPQNFPNSGPDVYECYCRDKVSYCAISCPWCVGTKEPVKHEWGKLAVESALQDIHKQDLYLLIQRWGDPVAVVSGCLRGLFVAKPGHDLICSDYSAIEAVVLAALAGEEWRLEVFRTHGKIYEMSASKVTGVPFQQYIAHRKETGLHHPDRKIGKVAELASGFGGWINAWKQFGADQFFTDLEIEDAICAWRSASPKIVEFWGNQKYGVNGLEGAAIAAVKLPGQEFSHRGVTYVVKSDILYCKLLSGRYIVYHKPRLSPSDRPGKSNQLQLSFEGWNTNPKNGPSHQWIRMRTYGGRLTENVVQATARDILAHAIINLEKAGYPVVLHVHDEIVCEIPEDFGTIAEFEKIMSTYPAWAKDWPLKAAGGWRGKRYGK